MKLSASSTAMITGPCNLGTDFLEGTGMNKDENEQDSLGRVLVMDPSLDEEKQIIMGTGSCKLCDCSSFVPSGSGNICANQNSAGGTCNPWDYEHN